MIPNEIKSEIKKLWNALWSGGIADPLAAMNQVSYFLYLRRLTVMDEEERERNLNSRNPSAKVLGPWEGTQQSTVRHTPLKVMNNDCSRKLKDIRQIFCS